MKSLIDNLCYPTLISRVYLFLLLCLLLFSNHSSANNLSISGITVNQTSSTVTFTISWDNSWNITGTGAPNNWDAVWIFVKYKDCSATAATAFTHAVLDATMANHTIPATLDAMTTVNGTIFESAIQGASIDYTDGIMLRPHTVGTGTIAASTVVLKIPALPAASTTLTVDVIGIEMVYVPQGNFTIGDGNTTISSLNSFLGSSTLNSAPLTVTSAFETGTSTYYLNNEPAGSVTTVSSVPAAFPKGQYGFYMMKYEISEGMYAEFLNTLGSGQVTNRLPGNFSTNRNQLVQTTTPYSSTRSDRAQNFLSWADLAAFLDWACLRPISETEFEKACRGNGSVYGELAWGNLVISAGTTFSGSENGTETFTSGNCVFNNTTFTNGDGGTGPARCGIFATSSSTRQTSGASYYGIMELSGNLMEYVIGLHSTGASNTFTRTWGNGVVDAAGNHDVGGGWPATGYVAVAGATNQVGTRGGSYVNGVAQCQVSDRYYLYQQAIYTKQSYTGGRGLR